MNQQDNRLWIEDVLSVDPPQTVNWAEVLDLIERVGKVERHVEDEMD